MPNKIDYEKEYRAAHDSLTWLAASIAWATDGRLPTAVRHVEEYVRRLRNASTPDSIEKVLNNHKFGELKDYTPTDGYPLPPMTDWEATCECGFILDEDGNASSFMEVDALFNRHVAEEIAKSIAQSVR